MRTGKNRLFEINRKSLIIAGSVFAAAALVAGLVLLVSANTKTVEKMAAVDELLSAGVVNVGLRTDLWPLCRYDDTAGTFEGLEKDVADEITGRLFGAKIIVNYVKVDSETKDALLLTGGLDMSLGASVAGGKAGIDYSDPFFTEGSAFLVRSGEMTSEDGINGGTVAVVQGSPEAAKYGKDKKTTYIENYLDAKKISASVKVYASYPEAVEALRKKFVTALCAPETFLKIYGRSGMLLLHERFIPCGYCVETRQSLKGLVTAVNETIREMQSDATMDGLITKWGLSSYTEQQ